MPEKKIKTLVLHNSEQNQAEELARRCLEQEFDAAVLDYPTALIAIQALLKEGRPSVAILTFNDELHLENQRMVIEQLGIPLVEIQLDGVQPPLPERLHIKSISNEKLKTVLNKAVSLATATTSRP